MAIAIKTSFSPWIPSLATSYMLLKVKLNAYVYIFLLAFTKYYICLKNNYVTLQKQINHAPQNTAAYSVWVEKQSGFSHSHPLDIQNNLPFSSACVLKFLTSVWFQESDFLACELTKIVIVTISYTHTPHRVFQTSNNFTLGSNLHLRSSNSKSLLDLQKRKCYATCDKLPKDILSTFYFLPVPELVIDSMKNQPKTHRFQSAVHQTLSLISGLTNRRPFACSPGWKKNAQITQQIYRFLFP